MAVISLELPILIFVAGLACGLIVWLLATFSHPLSNLFAQGTALTYQGRLILLC